MAFVSRLVPATNKLELVELSCAITTSSCYRFDTCKGLICFLNLAHQTCNLNLQHRRPRCSVRNSINQNSHFKEIFQHRIVLMVELQYRKVVTRWQNGAESVMRVIAGVVGRLSGHYQDLVVDKIDV